MTELVKDTSLKVEILRPIRLSAKDLQEAEFTKNAVEQLLNQIQTSEGSLRKNFARLGTVLLDVRQRKYWHAWGFPSFGRYIDSIKDRVGKGRTQLYHTIGVADKLLPYISPDELSEIGISKAVLLKQAVEKTGKAPTDEIIDMAENSTVSADELEAALFKKENRPENEHQKYWNPGGFFVTAEEKELILRAFAVAEKTDPVISLEIPEHARRKEIILRFAQEYLATYEALAEKGLA